MQTLPHFPCSDDEDTGHDREFAGCQHHLERGRTKASFFLSFLFFVFVMPPENTKETLIQVYYFYWQV